MKRKLYYLSAIFIILLLPAAAFGIGISPPPIPLLVYGNIAIDGQPAPIGMLISAEIETVTVATSTTTQAGKYFIEIPDGQTNEGKIIKFKVNGIFNEANQRQYANIGTTPSINFNLAVTTVSSSPSSSSGGGGGGGGIPPVTSTITKKGDANKDNKIDKYDFSLMMANWGKTGTNPCDFNNDGKVDKYDFALLMLNWGI